MGCNCGGASTASTVSTATSYASGPAKWIVYRADGTVSQEYASEAEARMEVTRSGGSMRRK